MSPFLLDVVFGTISKRHRDWQTDLGDCNLWYRRRSLRSRTYQLLPVLSVCYNCEPASLSATPFHRNTRGERKTGISAENTGQLPTANKSINHLVKVASEALASANRYIPNTVKVDQVSHVEVRHGATVPDVKGIQDKR